MVAYMQPRGPSINVNKRPHMPGLPSYSSSHTAFSRAVASAENGPSRSSRARVPKRKKRSGSNVLAVGPQRSSERFAHAMATSKSEFPCSH